MSEHPPIFDPTLMESIYPDTCPDTFSACLNSRGVYESQRFALRLSPIVHELVESAVEKSAAGIAATNEELHAYAVYLHETVHWWQHKGSTSGFMRSVLYPVQTHSNMERLHEILQAVGPLKSIKNFALNGELGKNSCRAEISMAANEVTNNFMDTEFYLALTLNPKLVEDIYIDPYFESAGHSFLLTYAQVLGAIGEMIDPEYKFLPHPELLAEKLIDLDSRRVQGYYFGTPITRPPVGVFDLYEGQARFIQLQFLARSNLLITIDDAKNSGMLHGVYGKAFEQFLRITKSPVPDAIIDPTVALFLFVCDMSINPTTGFPSAIKSYESFYLNADPGLRFAYLCEAIAGNSELLTLVKNYSADEYRQLAKKLGLLSGLGNHLDDLTDFRHHLAENTFAQATSSEHKSFKFTERNIVLKLLTGEFISYINDRTDNPEFFCWAGYWLVGTNNDKARQLWLSHLSLFSDKADDDALFPRMHPERNEADVMHTFNQFFASMLLYDLSKQWVLQPGPFKLDYAWLTSKYDSPDFLDQLNGVFKKHYGFDLTDFKALDPSSN
ncbi:hypothetical protein [Xanthomonas cannabis]|uniref:hypothetical protein n=1 Tax=Xanthomonas cannabis TaxID=1885674 RepID=UPI00141BE9FA|nr:hypothetical protein [Xanthomonas cannabis]NIK64385.1 hypothetical protein [Xanthomonas cannabis]